jgi:hypothetical protein
VLDELARIHSTDIVLPTASIPHRQLRLRCVVRPDRAQAALLDRLGLRLPQRLRIPINIDKEPVVGGVPETDGNVSGMAVLHPTAEQSARYLHRREVPRRTTLQMGSDLIR